MLRATYIAMNAMSTTPDIMAVVIVFAALIGAICLATRGGD